jgi:hypothetical protein
MRVGGGGSSAGAAAAAAAEAARRAAAEAARKAAAEAARKAAAEAARKAAAEAAKKAQEQAIKAREARQQAQQATQVAEKAKQAAHGATGPEKEKLQAKAQQATDKAKQAHDVAREEFNKFKKLAIDGEKKARQAQELSQAANDAAIQAGNKPLYKDVKGFEALKDTFEDGKNVKNAAEFQAKFGADCGTDMQALTRAQKGDFVSDQQLDEIAARVKVENPANGRDSDASRVEASKQLKAELQNLPPVSRQRLLERLGPTIEEMAKGANGTPDEEDRKDILRNLADAATMSGPQGAQLVSERFANVALNDHTDVDNGDQLGGALKAVINEDKRRAAFGFTLGNEMQARGNLDEASKNVLLGTYEAVEGLNPSKAERAFDDVKDKLAEVGGKILDAFADAFDFVTQPLTNALNDQIEKLGPGDSYKVGVGAHGQIKAVGVEARGELEVKRGEDGKYTVSASGELNADLAKKLKLPGLEVGVDGKVEFAFDNLEEAKRGADTLAQIAGAAVVGSATGIPGGGVVAGGAATVANLGDGDAQFLAENVSAVEVGGTVSADLSQKLGLPGMDAAGNGVGLSVEGGQRARIEFGQGDAPPSVTFTQNGKATGTAALGGGPPNANVSLQGEASASVTVQHKLTLPQDFGLGDITRLGDVARGSKVESSVQLQLQQKATVNGEVGPFSGGAEGSVTSTLEFKGDPAGILSKGLPKALQGDFEGARKAVGDHAEVNASVELRLKGNAGANANLGPGYVASNGEVEARLKLSGSPAELARKGIPKLFEGDLPGAVSAVGDKVKVEADLTQSKTTTGGIEVGDPLGLFGAEFTTERVDVRDKPLWSYGIDDPKTKANESRTASQAAGDLRRMWERLAA